MGRRRASNTVALLGGHGGLTEGTRVTEVRKIDNGHVVRKSSYGPNGESTSSERFVGRGSGTSSRCFTLKDAVDCAEGR